MTPQSPLPPGDHHAPGGSGNNRRVVGLDLSITATGIADREGHTATIRGAAGLGDRRLVLICDAVNAAIGMSIDLVVIEDLPTHAHGAGITGMVHGAVRAALTAWGVRYVLVPPASLKKYATGKGNANKVAMALAAQTRAGLEFTDDNRCDAWWLRAMGLDALGQPLFDLPKTHRSALQKIAWPELRRSADYRDPP